MQPQRRLTAWKPSLTLRPVKPLTLGASGSWTHARYSQFTDPTTGANRSQERFAGRAQVARVIIRNNREADGLRSRQRDRRRDISKSSTDFSPGNHATPDLSIYTSQRAYTFYDARATFKLERPILDISFMGRNLTDKRYFIAALDYTERAWGRAIHSLGPRRTFGVEVTKRF